MVTLYLLARLLFRKRNSLNAIGFAALCLLALDPRSLAGASFQMTLLSVLIVAGVAVPVAEHTFGPYLHAARNLGLVVIDPDLPPPLAQFRVTLRLIASHLQPFLGRRLARALPPALVRLTLRIFELLLVSGLIELAMSLPMAIYFHRITALGLPVNLLVVPLIGLALPSALITFATLLLVPSLAIVPAAVTAALLHAISGIVRLFSAMGAGDIRISSPGTVAIVAGILLIGLAVWAARNSRFPVGLPIAALACSAACVFYPRALPYHPGVLEVTAIDVGQGDSLLLVSPEGKTLLVDAGGPTGGAAQGPSANFEIGEDVVSPVLWSRNIRRLDAVALTHAHSDHMGGMPSVLRNFRPRVLWVGTNPDIPAYQALLAEAQRLDIPVEAMAAGSRFAFGGAQVDVLAPGVDYTPGTAASNDDSLVLHVAYGHTSVLLEGDAQAATERQMLSEELHADLLKVGHHGSKTSTIPPFLAAVAPSVCRHFGRPPQSLWPSQIGSPRPPAGRPNPNLSHRRPGRHFLLSKWNFGDRPATGGKVTRHLFCVGLPLVPVYDSLKSGGRVFQMGSSESDRNDESSCHTLSSPPATQSPQEKIEEQRKIRRLQMMMDMVMSVISQDGSLTVDQAAELVADSKKAALAMFPDKELAYNIIYKPRLQRLMRERYRIQ